MKKFVAQRNLWFSRKGDENRRRVTIGIYAPVVVTDAEVQYPVDGTISKCRVEIDGLDEPGYEIVGTDSLQAINLASSIENLIARLSDKYDFFWATGEPYFEEDSGASAVD
jgi:hypothetical protein